MTVPWPEPHFPPPPLPDAPPVMLPDSPVQRPVLRNYGDILYWLPELTAFRATDGAPLQVQEFGDVGDGEERLFLRRFLGAGAEPLTRVSDQLDRLPEWLSLSGASDVWAVWLLRVTGFPVVNDLPGWAARGLLRRMPDLMPVGRTAGYLVLAEAAFGRGDRSYSEDGLWALTTTSCPGGVSLTVAERLLDPSNQRAVEITLGGDVPDWFVRQVRRYRNAFFTARVNVARAEPRAFRLGVRDALPVEL
ncbi:hypothetical protein [Deinococcus kurensis]|uniref:hypothetical protein n=1 Tax=Deinococcus kurensis TaxID=2662757 RepID=UPI0012D30FAD|nr:hypothetical protein [Deinococcus kurensis]